MNSKQAKALLEAISKGTSTSDACASLGLDYSMQVIETALRVSNSKENGPMIIEAKKRGLFLPLSLTQNFGTNTFAVKVQNGKNPRLILFPIASEKGNPTPEESEADETETEQSEVPPQMQQYNPAIRSGTPELARV